jgi:hypothetical protein
MIEINRWPWRIGIETRNYDIGITYENCFRTVVGNKSGGTNTRDRSLNPVKWFKGIHHKIWWAYTKRKLKRDGKLWMQCEGCGEGIIKWKNKDPNDSRRRLYCCDGCFNFYGWNGTVREVTPRDWRSIKERFYNRRVENYLQRRKELGVTRETVPEISQGSEVPIEITIRILDKLEEKGRIKVCD